MGPSCTRLVASLVAALAGCGARTELRVLPVAAPRLIAPLSTSTVTTWRPTLAWSFDALPRGFAHDGARVELCRDPACASVVVTFDALGDHARPPADLAPGVWFWRARATDGGLVYGANDIVWEFRVTPRDSAVDSSRGTMFDANRDGLADIVSTGSVGCPGTGTPFNQTQDVYLSEPGRDVALDAIVRLEEPGSSTGPGSLRPVGDVNGDGFSDLVFVPLGDSEPGPLRLVLFPGGTDGVSLRRQSAVAGPADIPIATDRWTATPVGDVDRDGYGDIVVASYSRVLLFRGGPDGLVASRVSSLAVHSIVNAVAGLDDVDGDGFADVGIAVYDPASIRVEIHVFHGGAAGLDPASVTLVSIPSFTGTDTFNIDLDASGDVNGDGYADLVARVPYDAALDERIGRLHVFLGSAAGLVAPTTQVLMDGDAADQAFGYGAAACSDINGDGFDDVVTATHPFGITGPDPDAVAEFFGSAAGLPATPSQVVPAPDRPLAAIGYVVANAADVDADGFDDVAIYWCDANPPWFVTPLHRGGPAGLTLQPSAVLAP